MIWLASFPRSGNTFFRNVLYEVYGIASSTFHMDPNRDVDAGFAEFPVVKTHLLPGQLPFPEAKSVYIVRDGRDSLVSIAHHRKDIVEPGTDFYNNLLEAILSPGGSNFGGWPENVRQWVNKADILIHFEDLVRDPITQVERLREIMDLPQPDLSKLPTFQKLKFGDPQYGAGKPEQKHLELAKRHFRKGKIGGWQNEMPEDLEDLFWNQGGNLMQSLGYSRTSGYTGSPISEEQAINQPLKKVLIETAKLSSKDNDGVRRYLVELTEHLPQILSHYPDMQIDLYDRGFIKKLQAHKPDTAASGPVKFSRKDLSEEGKKLEGEFTYEKGLLLLKAGIHKILPGFIYDPLADFYRTGPFRKMLSAVRFWRARKMLGDFQQVNKELLDSYDLIHVPLPQNMHRLEILDKPFLVTVHDLTHKLFPEYHTPENVDLAEKGMQKALQKQANLLAISQATARDIQQEYQVPPDRIHLTLEAANGGKFYPHVGDADFPAIRELYGIPENPYLLCLSTIEPRKNLKNTVQAFLQFKERNPSLEHTLVICGKKGWKTEQLFEEIHADSDQIIFTGFVDDDHLPALYANARALCYVSYYEGFGLPLLEAMSCGTPVIYGNNSSMPEVVGPAGLPAEPDQVESICRQMERMIQDETAWKEMSALARKQANTFSWWKTAFDTVKVYRKLIDKQ
ncbi:MAG: glycosyltransferase [Saprospiraceae bacterium]|nr:glycosyltransferase [Saprospiraceae bacterium]